MIVDAHTHIGLQSFIVKPISEERLKRPAFRDPIENPLAKLIARMDANQVARAVAFAYPLEEVDATLANEYVLNAHRAFPERIIPFALVGDDVETWVARVTRGLVLALKEREFITAARVVGASNWRIMLKHILPNSLSPIIVGFSIGIAGTIMAEAGLSFLGIGIRPPSPSWGGMIDKGRQYLQVYPHLSVFPALALALTVLAFNFLGDGLRDALDPRMRKD